MRSSIFRSYLKRERYCGVYMFVNLFFFSFSPHLSVWSIVVADSRYHYDRLIVIVRFFTNLVFRDSTLRDFLFFSYGVNIAFEILSNEYLEY